MPSLIQADRVLETTTTTGTGNVTLAGAVAGFRTFGSVMANNDTCFYVIAGQTGTEWEVGIGTFVSATPALARSTVLASSNAGSLVSFSAGPKDVFITDPATRFALPEYTTDPGVPSSGALMYVRSLGGRMVPRFLGPSGLDSAVQPAMFANNVTMWLPGTGTTAAINFGSAWTIATTQSHPAIANTNFMTQMKRATFTTTTTVSNTTGPRSTAPVAWIGNISGAGGFFFAARFGILTYASTMRIWCGLSALTTAMTGATDPSAINDTCAMSKDTGETVWQCMIRGTAGVTKQTTGRTTAAAGSANIFDFYMFCKPNGTDITFRVVDATDGTVLVNNVALSGANMPTANVMLTAHCEAQNAAGGAGSAVAIFLNKIYIESDT